MRLSNCQKCGASPALVIGADSRYNTTFQRVCCSHKTEARLTASQCANDWNEAQNAFKKACTFPKVESKKPVTPVPEAYSEVLKAIKTCTDPEKLEAVKEYASSEIQSKLIIEAVEKRFRELEPLAHAANMLDLLK